MSVAMSKMAEALVPKISSFELQNTPSASQANFVSQICNKDTFILNQ